MIRTLLLVSAVSFVLAIGFFAGAIAIVGGPFNIGEDWRFHRVDISDLDVDIDHKPPTVIHASTAAE